MAVKIVVEILTPLSLSRREDGKLIFDLWKKYLPRLLPDNFGNWEPIDRKFDSENYERMLESWQWPFLAVKTTPAVNASIWMRKALHQKLHATWAISLEAGSVSQSELLEFLQAASVALNADFGCLHLLTASEIARGRMSKVVLVLDKRATKFRFAIGSKDLQQRIPDLFWATVFGAPYVKMFGLDRMLTVPVYSSRALSDGAVLLQTTENLSDVESHTREFEEVRSKAKSHLGPDAFFCSARMDNFYSAPQFIFQDKK